MPSSANAMGAWLAGVAVGAGLGWASTGWVGALLAVAGLLIFAVSLAEEGRNARSRALAESTVPPMTRPIRRSALRRGSSREARILCCEAADGGPIEALAALGEKP